MNVIFISPQFPSNYWNFCDRLRRNGVNVLGIGDAPYDGLSQQLKNALTEYYRVGNMEDYDQMLRAVAFFTFKYGKIDWIESNNEYWLGQDARLRTDFHVTTGVNADEIARFRRKSEMKACYAAGNIPSARCHLIPLPAEGEVLAKEKAEAAAFLKKVGYPVIVKPDIGVGACDTWKLKNDEEFDAFFAAYHPADYVMEEFVTGDIRSYDAICDSHGEPLFESMTMWPPSIMDIVNEKLHIDFFVLPEEANFFSVTSYAFRHTVTDGRLIYISLIDMIRGKYSIRDLSGPVGIVNVIGDVIESETKENGIDWHGLFEQILSLAAFITINLGLFNLLPLPALDGGRLIFLIIEGIRGKPVPPEKEGMVHFVGMALLLLLMAVITVSDIIKLF